MTAHAFDALQVCPDCFRPHTRAVERCARCDSGKKWDLRFLDLAALVSTWSKDRSRRVGAVIVGADREVIAIGYNGLPRGVDDTVDERLERPAKYLWTEHSERNAIYNAARLGVPLKGTTMYLPWFPCADCVRAVIQSGITTLVCGQEPDFDDPQWGPGFRIAADMLAEGGVTLRLRTAP